MNKKIGVLTIGQSPRTDVVPELQEYWGEQVKIVEAGALDGLSLQEIDKLAPREGDSVLVSRLKDGSWVKLAEEKLIPLLREKIDFLNEQKVNLILLLCTGTFPPFVSESLLIQPHRIIRSTVAGLLPEGKKLGLIVPDQEQVGRLVQDWSEALGSKNSVVAVAGSPYESLEGVGQGAEQLKGYQPELVLLDCMGYNKEMKQIVGDMVGKPVILARGLLGRVVAELLGVQ